MLYVKYDTTTVSTIHLYAIDIATVSSCAETGTGATV